MNHYVGQEKLAPMDSWSSIMVLKIGAHPLDYNKAIWHYINSSQWRYDGNQKYYNSAPDNDLANMHSADWTVKAVRNGWMPYYPQYSKNNFEIVKKHKQRGHTTDEEMRAYVVEQLKVER